MADKYVLSQEEIDALLKAVGESSEGEDHESGTQVAASDKKKQPTDTPFEPVEISREAVKTLNFAAQERIVKGKLSVLDRIYDRAVGLFASDIYNITTRDFEIKQDPLLIIKHRDFMESLPNPSLMGIYKFKPLRGKGIILFDSACVYNLVDYYIDGSSQFAQKDRADFTVTELRVMDMITKKLIAKLTNTWKSIIQIDITKFNDETNPKLVNIAEPEERILVARFSLDFGKEKGLLYFILPYSMIEPIKEQLGLGTSDDEIDPNWINSFKEELMDVELMVSSVMAEAKSTLGDVMSWQVGYFIPMEMKEVVTLDIEGTPGFTVTQCIANEKRALKIIKNISY